MANKPNSVTPPQDAIDVSNMPPMDVTPVNNIADQARQHLQQLQSSDNPSQYDTPGFWQSLANSAGIPTSMDQLKSSAMTGGLNMMLPGMGTTVSQIEAMRGSKSPLEAVNRINPMATPMAQIGEGNWSGFAGSVIPPALMALVAAKPGIVDAPMSAAGGALKGALSKAPIIGKTGMIGRMGMGALQGASEALSARKAAMTPPTPVNIPPEVGYTGTDFPMKPRLSGDSPSTYRSDLATSPAPSIPPNSMDLVDQLLLKSKMEELYKVADSRTRPNPGPTNTQWAAGPSGPAMPMNGPAMDAYSNPPPFSQPSEGGVPSINNNSPMAVNRTALQQNSNMMPGPSLPPTYFTSQAYQQLLQLLQKVK